MKKFYLVISLIFILSGCATANKIGGVKIGMTKEDVIAVMGKPVSTSAQGQLEYLNYALSETGYEASIHLMRPYYVRLLNGRVESYGRTGDFDSTKNPTVRIEKDQTVKQDIQVKGSSDLYTELMKLEDLKNKGIITNEEFEAQKKKLLNEN